MRNVVDVLKDKQKRRVAIFASGAGSNAEAIIKFSLEHPDSTFRVVLIISNLATAKVHQVAERFGINNITINDKEYTDSQEYIQVLLQELSNSNIDVIVLAGYLRKVPAELVEKYDGRILNIHPALLPKYGGKGMYGMHVHKAVIESGEDESGITIHIVNSEYDKGKHLKQVRVNVLPTDTPEVLASRILAVEHSEYPLVINEFCSYK